MDYLRYSVNHTSLCGQAIRRDYIRFMDMNPTRRCLVKLALAAPLILTSGRGYGLPTQVLDAASAYPQLRSICIWSGGREIAARGYGRYGPDDPVNIKSASKSIISALIGIAISKGLLQGVDQPLAQLMPDSLPKDQDPRLHRLTIGNLLSMQAGLERQSGANYGRWVASANWVNSALAAPFVADPGGPMLYSTASTHLLSAVLTRASRRSTLDLAREWLGPIPGFRITAWERDPQGIYIGGNEMAMSTRSLLAFGATYAARGIANARQVVPQEWIVQSWQPRTRSAFTRSDYGYGWFLARMGGREVNYGWGYGGQMIYVAPATERYSAVAIAITSDPTQPSGANGYREQLHQIAVQLMQSVQGPVDGRGEAG